MLQKIKVWIFEPRMVLLVYVVLAIIAAVQLYSIGYHNFVMPRPGSYADDIMHKPELLKLFIGTRQVDYNNYVIFRQSWFHLLHGTNLYGVYPTEHWDFYKYSPTFAVFMSTLAYLPDLLGLTLWNVLNAVTLFFAVRMLPFSTRTQCALLWFAAFEMLTSVQIAQSNSLMCGLIILAYGCMQQRKIFLATLWIALSAYIKVYGAVGFCLFLFYPEKGKFILYAAFWMIVLAALPLLVTPLHTLIWQYQNWGVLLKADATTATGLSVAGWLHSWFGLDNVKTVVTVAGTLLFLLPFVRFDMYRNETHKLLMLAFMLIWIVIFNHKAESPTYIIAVAGAGIWYYSQPKTQWHTILIWIVLIFTSISGTDIFPPYVRKHFMYPYTIKAVPCIIVWCVALAELMLMKKGQELATGSSLRNKTL